MSCGFMEHIFIYDHYDPQNHHSVERCMNCGLVKSYWAGPQYVSQVRLECCQTSEEWVGSEPPTIGSEWQCPRHNLDARVVEVSWRQTKPSRKGGPLSTADDAESITQPTGASCTALLAVLLVSAFVVLLLG